MANIGKPIILAGGGAAIDDFVLDRGTLDIDTVTELPAAEQGHRYRVTGTATGVQLGLGDDLIAGDEVECLVDGTVANTPANWRLKRASGVRGTVVGGAKVGTTNTQYQPYVDGVHTNGLITRYSSLATPSAENLIITIAGTQANTTFRNLHMDELGASDVTPEPFKGVRALTNRATSFDLPASPVSGNSYLLYQYVRADGTFGLYGYNGAFSPPADAVFGAHIGFAAYHATGWVPTAQYGRAVSLLPPTTIINGLASSTELDTPMQPDVPNLASSVLLHFEYSCDPSATSNGFVVRTSDLHSPDVEYSVMGGVEATAFKTSAMLLNRSGSLYWRTLGRPNEQLTVKVLGYSL